MAKKTTTETKVEEVKVPMYQVKPGKEKSTVMAKGGPYKLWESPSQKVLKFLFELGHPYVIKNG